MTDRYKLSADIGQAHFARSPILSHAPPESFEGLAWYVVYCNVKCERRAQLGLRRSHYATYLPMQKVDIRHARKVEVVEKPLLPRYLFLGLKPGQDFYAMRSVDGVEALVRNNMVPVQVNGKGLARLRDRETAGEFDYSGTEKRRKADLVASCKPGTPILIKDGPMAGLQAIVQAVQASGRVEALIEFLGQATPLTIPVERVELLEAVA